MQADSAQIQSDAASANNIIRSYLQDNLEMLLQTMRLYVTKAKFAGGQGVGFAAEELLGKIMNITLEKGGTFHADSLRTPGFWALPPMLCCGTAARV